MNNSRWRIFVGAFIDGEFADQVQNFRKQVDPRTAAVCPPHVTLAGTYYRDSGDEGETIAMLERVLSGEPVFLLHFTGIGVFDNRTPVIHLTVEKTPPLLTVRDRILRILGPDRHPDFTPHLTLSMRLKHAAANKFLNEARMLDWLALPRTVEIHRLQLMQRGRQDASWRCLQKYLLKN
jgi:2'-5' RNA ligase